MYFLEGHCESAQEVRKVQVVFPRQSKDEREDKRSLSTTRSQWSTSQHGTGIYDASTLRQLRRGWRYRLTSWSVCSDDLIIESSSCNKLNRPRAPQRPGYLPNSTIDSAAAEKGRCIPQHDTTLPSKLELLVLRTPIFFPSDADVRSSRVLRKR